MASLHKPIKQTGAVTGVYHQRLKSAVKVPLKHIQILHLSN